MKNSSNIWIFELFQHGNDDQLFLEKAVRSAPQALTFSTNIALDIEKLGTKAMKIKEIDSFITSTQSLLSTNPSNTTISITYSHCKKDDGKVRSIIKFKTFDAKHGICYTFKTHKIKEFSKLCNAFGPRGCNVQGKDVDGLSLLISNVDKKDVVTEVVAEPAAQEKTPAAETSSTQKKKKNKKKGKK